MEQDMVLITGATGFVGMALLRQLMEQKREVGCLLRPSSRERRLPPGEVRVATGTLQDRPALRAALQGADTVVHLVGARREQDGYTLDWINDQGTFNLVEAALDADVRRIIYLSHIRANPSSAYPILRSKGVAEEIIRGSGLSYTILRSSLIFGPGDSFTTILAMLIKFIPLVFPIIGGGKTRFQPLHVDDVARCLAGCLDAYHLENTTLDIGGPQHLSYDDVLDVVMEAMRVRRLRLRLRLPAMHALVNLSERLFPNPPVSREQLDLFSIDNTTDLGNVPRNFDFQPLRFSDNLGYLRRKGWRRAFLRYVYRGEKK
jgi:NADH dehydrogenase